MTTRALYALTLGVVLLGSPCLKAEPRDDGQALGGRKAWMKEDLKLSDSQKDQMREANKANRTATAPLLSQLQNDRDDLKALVGKKAKDEALTQALDKLKQDREAMRAQEAKHREAIAAILTPLQQAKMALRMGRGRGAWGEGRWGKGKACANKGGKGPKPGDEPGDQPGPAPEQDGK
jgi:Spy/CpxP family protein refolding chaperone